MNSPIEIKTRERQVTLTILFRKIFKQKTAITLVQTNFVIMNPYRHRRNVHAHFMQISKTQEFDFDNFECRSRENTFSLAL